MEDLFIFLLLLHLICTCRLNHPTWLEKWEAIHGKVANVESKSS